MAKSNVTEGGIAADEFIAKLKGGSFTMARSQNSGEDYTLSKQKRDSEAVEKFLETNLFQEIIKFN